MERQQDSYIPPEGGRRFPPRLGIRYETLLMKWMVRLRVVMESLERDRRVELRLRKSCGETSCLQALHEPSVLVRGGDPACIGFAHPPVPMTRNIIVQRITQGTWNKDAEIE